MTTPWWQALRLRTEVSANAGNIDDVQIGRAGHPAPEAIKFVIRTRTPLSVLPPLQESGQLVPPDQKGTLALVGFQPGLEPAQHRILVDAKQLGDFLDRVGPGRLDQAKVVPRLAPGARRLRADEARHRTTAL